MPAVSTGALYRNAAGRQILRPDFQDFWKKGKFRTIVGVANIKINKNNRDMLGYGGLRWVDGSLFYEESGPIHDLKLSQ